MSVNELLYYPGFPPRFSRKDFPASISKCMAEPLVYLDNAATTQKPKA